MGVQPDVIKLHHLLLFTVLEQPCLLLWMMVLMSFLMDVLPKVVSFRMEHGNHGSALGTTLRLHRIVKFSVLPIFVPHKKFPDTRSWLITTWRKDTPLDTLGDLYRMSTSSSLRLREFSVILPHLNLPQS